MSVENRPVGIRSGIVLAAFSFCIASAAIAKGPLQVFVLAGQSNMEGMGEISGGIGTLRYLVSQPETAARYRHLRDERKRWTDRSDVRVWFRGRAGNLGFGFGATPGTFGPELQFGHVIGDAISEPVLIVKAAWGAKTLYRDFRPPSSGLPDASRIAAVLANVQKRRPQASLADIESSFGAYYRRMIQLVESVVNTPRLRSPADDGQGYRIAGFGWHQGWSDGISARAAAEYEVNLANLIRDVRKDLGEPGLPFVIANSGFGGWKNENPMRLQIAEAQLAVAKIPEFLGNVATVETRDFYRPPEASPSRIPIHWNANAETFFLMGDAMGEAMKELMENATSDPK